MQYYASGANPTFIIYRPAVSRGKTGEAGNCDAEVTNINYFRVVTQFFL